jgi:hypothetical protein
MQQLQGCGKPSACWGFPSARACRGLFGISINRSLNYNSKAYTPEPALKPIEPIDEDQLVELMEKMKLGLKPTYIACEDFFDDFEETHQK